MIFPLARPGQGNTVGRRRPRLTVASPRYHRTAISFDPRDVLLSPAATLIDALIRPAALAIVNQNQGEFDRMAPGVAGSVLHKRFAEGVKALVIPGADVETSFKADGTAAFYSEKGSIRTDAMFTNPLTLPVECVWDWKINGAQLTAPRAQRLVEQVLGVFGRPEQPGYQIPVVELHVDLV